MFDSADVIICDNCTSPVVADAGPITVETRAEMIHRLTGAGWLFTDSDRDNDGQAVCICCIKRRAGYQPDHIEEGIYGYMFTCFRDDCNRTMYGPVGLTENETLELAGSYGFRSYASSGGEKGVQCIPCTGKIRPSE